MESVSFACKAVVHTPVDQDDPTEAPVPRDASEVPGSIGQGDRRTPGVSPEKHPPLRLALGAQDNPTQIRDLGWQSPGACRRRLKRSDPAILTAEVVPVLGGMAQATKIHQSLFASIHRPELE